MYIVYEISFTCTYVTECQGRRKLAQYTLWHIVVSFLDPNQPQHGSLTVSEAIYTLDEGLGTRLGTYIVDLVWLDTPFPQKQGEGVWQQRCTGLVTAECNTLAGTSLAS